MKKDNWLVKCDDCGGNIDTSKGYNPTCGRRLGGGPPNTRVWVGSKFHFLATTITCADLICPDCLRDDTVRRYSQFTGKPLGFGNWLPMHPSGPTGRHLKGDLFINPGGERANSYDAD